MSLLPIALVAAVLTTMLTGFSDGDIRGWFWVEMPKHPR